MKKINNEDEIKPEYSREELGVGVRGRYYNARKNWEDSIKNVLVDNKSKEDEGTLEELFDDSDLDIWEW